jgi:glycosyltransferase involved in cell wall biosynthesis
MSGAPETAQRPAVATSEEPAAAAHAADGAAENGAAAGAASPGAIDRAKRVLPRGLRRRLTPPLGHLRAQYEPRELRVPRSYLRETAPQPAPPISIVVPSLNYGHYLQATLDSVLDQGYPELELIVADGGSEDQTLELLEREGDRLAHVHGGPDSGQAEAINKGLGGSSGEILAWINADDLLLPGTLAYVARYFERNPGVDLVYGNRVLIDEQGRDVGVWVTPRHGLDSLRWFDFIPQETAFWRRDIWERVGGIDTGFDYGFDWDLFLRFHEAGATIRRLPRFLGAFRQHDDQKTRRNRDRAQAELESIRQGFHGRDVTIEEAKTRSRRLLIRSAPHHVMHRCGRLVRRSVKVEVAPNGNGSNGAPPGDR